MSARKINKRVANYIPFYEPCKFCNYGWFDKDEKEENLRKKIINSQFLNDLEKYFKLKNFQRLKKNPIEA